ncbi:MAG TPA: MOSC domain-containing protein [Myxococcaceae bacterium]|jgi:MOSC domain-containing protein YiiM|nr:MOSC domain-containing protein [Myxococcaceae bacterium]
MGEPGTTEQGTSGRVVHLFLAQVSGTPAKPVPEAIAVAARGFEGDRHARRAPGGKRQLLLLDARHLRELDLIPGTLKENAVIEGLPLEAFPAGQRLRLGAALVELTGPCEPCHKVEALRPGLLRESWGRRGQLARVLEGGSVRVGDAVEVLEVNADVPKRIVPKLR